MTAAFLVEHSGRRVSRSEASRKAWVTRKQRALVRAVGAEAGPPPAPHAQGGTTVREILDRLRAAAERQA